MESQDQEPRRRKPAQVCPGSDRDTGAFPGDEDRCPVCGSWTRVKADGRLRRHRRVRRPRV